MDISEPSFEEWPTRAQQAALDEVKRKLAEEMRADVKRLEAEDRARWPSQNIYGPLCRASSGGYAPTPRTPTSPEEKLQTNFVKQFNGAPVDRYGVRQGLNPVDVDRYATTRFVSHLQSEIARHAGYR